MGYGIICWLDDTAARALRDAGTAEVIGETLRDAVGTDAYPSSGVEPRTAGPWTVAASAHSNTLEAFVATRDGLLSGDHDPIISEAIDELTAEELEGGRVGELRCDSVWIDTLRSSDHHRLVTETMHHPHKFALAQARAGGGPLADVVLGAQHAAATSTGSAWWFHAAAINYFTETEAAQVGTKIAALLDTHWAGEVSIAHHANAIGRAGALMGDDSVLVVWSGNRLIRAGLLEDTEQARLQRIPAAHRAGAH